MKLSYYTIDDLRLGYDPQGENGWRLSRFLSWQDAMAQYRSLPDSAVKVIGVSSGEQDVELVRHLLTDADDTAWENVLVLDFLALPLWKKEKGVVSFVKELASRLDIRYCLTADKLVPAPIAPPKRGYAPLNLPHWEYLKLARRTQERLDHKKN